MDGTILGHFAIVEKIGEGGMGVVYKARDTRLGRTVAIKALPDSKIADVERKLRFAREAKTASALNHPNIITIYDITEHHDRSYIVMEFVDGKPLGQLIPKKGMGTTEALRIAVQVADALAAAHRAGIVHRDLKPGNIMLDSQGRLAAVLGNEPKPLGELSPTTPPEVERLVVRCLRKDVNKRSQNMSDVKLALEELRDESESSKLMRPASAITPAHLNRRKHSGRHRTVKESKAVKDCS